MLSENSDYVILGAGLSGMAAASILGDRAVVLERDSVPGGLVRAFCKNGFWFDHVLHLLYFSDERTERRILSLLGEMLQPCTPLAWVETKAGRTQYPFQMHLGGLNKEARIRCLHDLAAVTFGPAKKAENFEEMLRFTFGGSMYDIFLQPYNEKVWKRPLSSLAPSGFQWNITHPDFKQVLAGAISAEQSFSPYNATGWYPQPPADYAVRGMEVVSRSLANQVHDIRYGHRVVKISEKNRTVTTQVNNEVRSFRYDDWCCSTLPLPRLIEICEDAPKELKGMAKQLKHNNVITVAMCIEGDRPSNTGHWCYYSDPEIIFTRLIYMHAFDPLSAPEYGWGLMAEITVPDFEATIDSKKVIETVCSDARKVGAISDNCRILSTHILTINPAYVVFEPSSKQVVDDIVTYLRENRIEPLGRYGRWEYSSMSQVMRDGFAWAELVTQGYKPLINACADDYSTSS